MEQPHSVVADWLSKFHTWPAFIQMLWLVAPLAALLGTTWLVMRGLRDIAVIMRRPPSESTSLLVYGVVQDAKGQWHVLPHGREPEAPRLAQFAARDAGEVVELD